VTDARVLAAAVDELRSALAAERVVLDPEKLEAYGRDESDLGVFPPEVVAYVESAEEVRRVFTAASRSPSRR
jgi:glycolate oxidase